MCVKEKQLFEEYKWALHKFRRSPQENILFVEFSN